MEKRKSSTLLEDKQISIQNKEESVEITWKTYVKYLFYSNKNKFLLPVTVVIFILTEVTSIIYYRILSQYDLVKNGNGNTTI